MLGRTRGVAQQIADRVVVLEASQPTQRRRSNRRVLAARFRAAIIIATVVACIPAVGPGRIPRGIVSVNAPFMSVVVAKSNMVKKLIA